MAMYTVNIKTLIELEAYKLGIDINVDINKYLEIGKTALFDYPFSGDDEFKQSFINSFIMYYFNENITEDFPPLWVKKLQLQVQRTSKIFYEFWKMLQNINADNIAEYDKYISTSTREGTANDLLKGSTHSEGVNKTSAFPDSVNINVSVDDVKYSADGSKNETEAENESSKDSEFFEKAVTTDSRIANLYDKYTSADLTKIDIINEFVKSFQKLFILVW